MRSPRRTPALVLSGLFFATISVSTPLWFTNHDEAASSPAAADSLAAARYSQDSTRASRSETQSLLSKVLIDTTTTAAPVAETTTVPPTTEPPAPPTPPAAAIPAPKASTHAASAPAAKKAVTQAASPAAADPTPANVSAASSPNVTNFLLNAVNGERKARGLAPLSLDPTLTKMAQDWSSQMASNGAMTHSGNGIPSGFNAYGENVLKAGSSATAGVMHNSWLASSGHRKQMLQPGYNTIGIGAVCVNGSVYATETFGHTSSSGDANLTPDIPDASAKAPVSGGPTC